MLRARAETQAGPAPSDGHRRGGATLAVGMGMHKCLHSTKHRVPTAQGKQRKWLEILPAGKTQGISKFCKIQGKQGICI